MSHLTKNLFQFSTVLLLNKEAAQTSPSVAQFGVSREPESREILPKIEAPENALPLSWPLERLIANHFVTQDAQLEALLLDILLKGILEEYIKKALHLLNIGRVNVHVLHHAIYFKSIQLSRDVTRILIEEGLNTNVPDASMSFPLHYAAEKNRLFLVKYLLIHGADVNHVNTMCQTALHIAVEKGNAKITSLLLREPFSAKVDAADHYGRTPLHLAYLNHSSEIAMILKNCGATDDIKDMCGQTSENIAKNKGFAELNVDVRYSTVSSEQTTSTISIKLIPKELSNNAIRKPESAKISDRSYLLGKTKNEHAAENHLQSTKPPKSASLNDPSILCSCKVCMRYKAQSIENEVGNPESYVCAKMLAELG